MLTLVFVQTLYLNVKDAVCVKCYTEVGLYILCKALLIVKLDLAELVKDLLVVLKLVEVGKLGSVLLESVADSA